MPHDPTMEMQIRSLGDADSARRERAAAAIFRLGRERAMAAVARWLADSDVAKLFVADRTGALAVTVGIAVRPETFEQIRSANGSPRLSDAPPDQDAKEFELHFAGGIHLDILTTRDANAGGAIARFLEKFGEGVQQMEFLVSSAEIVTELLRTRFGIEAIYPAPQNGADGTRVNFVLAVTPEGGKALIELVETKRQA